MFDSDKYQQTWADIKQFASTKFDLLKVGFLEKAARIVGLILFALVLVLLLFAVISFGCLALIYALGQTLPMWASALIVVALWLLIMTGAIVFRQQLFINPMLAAISSILFEPTDKEQPQQSTDIVPAGKEVSHE
ncbi:MAG: phage holin family protein [Paludibacteraceae bacterium]|jgi:uncharacterized membrane protein YqjE|nr:phage holin family protein [Paludibacteraceae bacterium]